MRQTRECMYGEDCYRRSAQHFKEFSHPHLEALLLLQKGDEIALPNGFTSSMEPNVIIEQLTVLSSIKKATDSVKQPNVISKKSDELKPQLKATTHCAGTSAEKRKISLDSVVEKIPEKKSNVEEESVPINSSAPTTSETFGATLSSRDLHRRPQPVQMKTDDDHKGNFMEKWKSSLPYNFFLTAIAASPCTQRENLSVKFKDLIDPSMGAVESSLQINFMIELDWLLNHYESAGIRNKPLLILYGVEDAALKDKRLLGDNVRAFHIKPPHPFGHHHTKMSIFKYSDGSVRVIVSTANLIESDWENRTQGVWVSPRCMPMPDGANNSDGESPTNFRIDLVRYLSSYQLTVVQEWIVLLRKIDFSSIRVCFVGSVPGSHKGVEFKHWGHKKAAHLLRSHSSSTCRSGEQDSGPWPLVIQCSSIGSLGASPSAWVCGEFRSSLSETVSVDAVPSVKQPSVKVVYPSLKNVLESHDGILGGVCLPYSMKTHVKQQWLSDYLHQWRSEVRYRSRAVPHIKTYLRWQPGTGGARGGSRLAWFLLTSANLSKAAWGSVNKSGAGLYIMSFEAGVLFLPKFFATKEGEESFPLSEGGALPPFPVPYDLPLTPYGPNDKVWTAENLL